MVYELEPYAKYLKSNTISSTISENYLVLLYYSKYDENNNIIHVIINDICRLIKNKHISLNEIYDNKYMIPHIIKLIKKYKNIDITVS